MPDRNSPWTVADAIRRIESRILRGEVLDAHKALAAEMFGVPEDQVTEEMRGVAKARSYVFKYSGMGFRKMSPNDYPFAKRTDR